MLKRLFFLLPELVCKEGETLNESTKFIRWPIDGSSAFMIKLNVLRISCFQNIFYVCRNFKIKIFLKFSILKNTKKKILNLEENIKNTL